MKKELAKILQSQGFGSRRECTWLVKKSGVTIDGKDCRDPKEKFETEGLVFEVASKQWAWREHIYIMLNKPVGHECSHTPEFNPGIFELLPDHFLNRKIQAAGRLDVDTSGLLLLSDDGKFIHHVTSPKKGVSKTYRATLKHPFAAEQKQKLINGIELNNETGIFKATNLEEISETEVRLTIDRGCYHQVRRMFAAVSNRVTDLTREKIGDLELPEDLEPGDWCFLESEDLEKIGWK